MNTIDTANPRGESFINLVGDLQTDIKTLIKKEIELAKAEMREKFTTLGRNAALAAGGGVLALIAVFMLLMGVGAIVAQLLLKAGLSAGTAYFLSYTGLSLALGAAGYALLQKARHAFAEISLSPEKALETVRGPEPIAIEIRKSPKEPKRSSDELRNEVVSTRARMDSEMTELRERLTPGYMVKSSFAGLKHHPLWALLVGASTGLGGYLVWRKRHVAEVKRLHAHRKWWQFKLHHA
jgi:hypothetical protein